MCTFSKSQDLKKKKKKKERSITLNQARLPSTQHPNRPFNAQAWLPITKISHQTLGNQENLVEREYINERLKKKSFVKLNL